jgi:hypothetical protein
MAVLLDRFDSSAHRGIHTANRHRFHLGVILLVVTMFCGGETGISGISPRTPAHYRSRARVLLPRGARQNNHAHPASRRSFRPQHYGQRA